MNEEHEYIRVEVSRKEYTELYIKVPKGWRPNFGHRGIITKAIAETRWYSDWDNEGWEDTVKVNWYEPVEKSKADRHGWFDATSEIK